MGKKHDRVGQKSAFGENRLGAAVIAGYNCPGTPDSSPGIESPVFDSIPHGLICPLPPRTARKSSRSYQTANRNVFTTVSNLLTRLPQLDDHAAWRTFDRRYSPLLNSYFRKTGAPATVAADLAQETLQRVATGLRAGTFSRGQGQNCVHWIGGIARNVLRNHVRKLKVRSNTHRVRTAFWADQADPEAEQVFTDSDNRFDAIWVRSRMSNLLRLAAKTFDLRDLRCLLSGGNPPTAHSRGCPSTVDQ